MFVRVLFASLLLSCLLACRESSPKILVEYGRSGGFVGLNDQLIINNSGQATLTRQTGESVFQVDAETLTQLQQAFDDTSFTQLDKNYLSESQGADQIQYSISHNGHTVGTMDGAVPEQLQKIISILNQIIESEQTLKS